MGDRRCFHCALRIPTRVLFCGLCEPGFEPRLTQSRVIAGKESAFAQLHAVAASVWVCDNFSRILVCGETLSDEFIETKLFRPPDCRPR